jgi:membrane protein
VFNNLLSTPTAQLGRASRFIVFQIKLWSHCARLLKINRAGQQAAALSYHTIFGIVPLAIVTLLIFQSLPAYSNVGEKVKVLIYDQVHLTNIQYSSPTADDPERTIKLTEHIDKLINNFFAKANKGAITIVSVILVIWAALALLSTIEKAFNNIWHVAKGRNILHRMINYWALLTLGPLLLGAGIYVTTRYAAIGQIQKTIMSHIGPVVLSYLVAVVALFLLYFVLPNTKVQTGAALWGAAIAGIVWMLAKWGFGEYVTRFIPYSKIYGVMGLIPLGVLWIFITWIIVLFGLQLTFTTQHLKTLDAAEIATARKREEHFIANDVTAINIMREIAIAFDKNEKPVPPEIICSKLGMPGELGEKILDHLVASGLLVKTTEPTNGFVPATVPENISLSRISEAVAKASFGQLQGQGNNFVEEVVESERKMLEAYNLRQLIDQYELIEKGGDL